MANLRECIKLPVVDVIFLAVYRWSKAIEYFLRIVLLNTFFAALNILRCNLLNISDVVLNINKVIECFCEDIEYISVNIEYKTGLLNILRVY
jgi:hypothetical protein